jgi:hypothetical protein
VLETLVEKRKRKRKRERSNIGKTERRGKRKITQGDAI